MGEQCVKVGLWALIHTCDVNYVCFQILDLLSRGDSKSVFDAGGLPCVLKLTTLGTALHKDALYSSVSAAIHLCPRVDPDYQHLSFVCLHITQLMESDDRKVALYIHGTT